MLLRRHRRLAETASGRGPLSEHRWSSLLPPEPTASRPARKGARPHQNADAFRLLRAPAAPIAARALPGRLVRASHLRCGGVFDRPGRRGGHLFGFGRRGFNRQHIQPLNLRRHFFGNTLQVTIHAHGRLDHPLDLRLAFGPQACRRVNMGVIPSVVRRERRFRRQFLFLSRGQDGCSDAEACLWAHSIPMKKTGEAAGWCG